MFFNPHLSTCLERREERETLMGERRIYWLPTGDQTYNPTQVCALTWNRTANLLVCRAALNQLSHSVRLGCFCF